MFVSISSNVISFCIHSIWWQFVHCSRNTRTCMLKRTLLITDHLSVCVCVQTKLFFFFYSISLFFHHVLFDWFVKHLSAHTNYVMLGTWKIGEIAELTERLKRGRRPRRRQIRGIVKWYKFSLTHHDCKNWSVVEFFAFTCVVGRIYQTQKISSYTHLMLTQTPLTNTNWHGVAFLFLDFRDGVTPLMVLKERNCNSHIYSWLHAYQMARILFLEHTSCLRTPRSIWKHLRKIVRKNVKT